MENCTCSHVFLSTTDAIDWNPGCSGHGINSEWYNSEAQTVKRFNQNKMFKVMFDSARNKS